MRLNALLGLLMLAGCAAGSDDQGGGSAEGGSPPSTGGQGEGGSGFGGGFNDGGNTFVGEPEVFGHSRTTLYKLNPTTKDVGIVDTFKQCANIEDIALDKDSNLYGTNAEGLYSIDKETASCTLIAAGDYPNSLSFVPAGTLDPGKEALVGFLDDQYVRIDTVTGAITNVGAPWGNDFVSSGDIVSVKDGPTYLTIKDADPDANVCADCLVTINPATGAILKDYGSLGYDKVFGAAFWAGSVYGFTNDGELFEIVVENNQLTTNPIATPDGLSFWGAGSTTSAPPTAE
ncbi:MAG: hypothetical protein JNK04_08420 [Myxococcales bacterium]|nr:hypothetical protein [Myxococcales bacterium]